MRDDNDFFDELIDDEAETYTSEFDAEEDFDGDDEDEEDDEESETRTAVLAKRGMLALLTVRTNAAGGQIVRVDPRQQLPTAQSYDTAESAVQWFKRSLATSRKNGWEIVYDGAPMVG